MSSIVIVEDEAPLRQSLKIALQRAGHEVTDVGSVAAAQAALTREVFDLALLDLRLPDGDGLSLLENIGPTRPDMGVIVMSAYGSVDTAVQAMRAGAFDFLEKPFGPERLIATVARALEHCRLRAELRRRGHHGGEVIIGDSPPMREVRQRVQQALGARVVFVSGETGTGKDIVARAIHGATDPTSPFVVVHCATLPIATIDSELFGHVHGAFVGATARRGLLREAEGGTVYFDEIAGVPAELQPKLLRFFEGGEVRPVGADRAIRVQCRVIVGTARDLVEEVREGRVRSDLRYRLDVFRIALPPLRERRQDIVALATHLGQRLAARMHRPAPIFEREALEVLAAHDWPGNVRELEHTIERALLLADDDGVLTPDLVSPMDEDRDPTNADDAAAEGGSVQSLAMVERAHILRVLDSMGGDRTQTARALGVSRSTLRRKLIVYDRWGRRTRSPDGDGSK